MENESQQASPILDFKGAPRNAQLHTKIVYYRHGKSGRILMGAPEQYPAPAGYVKIVCNSTHEAELWSSRLREQDTREAELSDYARELIEAPMRAELRSDLRKHVYSGSNEMTRQFARYALKKLDDMDAKGKTIRESYLHVEAFEAGK